LSSGWYSMSDAIVYLRLAAAIPVTPSKAYGFPSIYLLHDLTLPLLCFFPHFTSRESKNISVCFFLLT
jgi:hypothetical protein